MTKLRALSLLFALLMLGCPAGRPPEGAQRTPPPATQRFESFGQVRVVSVGRHLNCETLVASMPCSEATLRSLTPIRQSMMGSSMVVAHARGKTYALTAQHVCSPPGLVDTVVFSGVRQTIMARIEWETKVVVVDINGTMREAVPVIQDVRNDMCVLEVTGVWGRPVPLAARPLSMGETAYNVGAPAGIFDVGMVPIFVGIYSGSTTNLSEDELTSRRDVELSEVHLYTFPSRPGSSGSAVLTPAGEIVGVVHSTVPSVHGLSIASSWASTRVILRRLAGYISDL